MQGSQGGRKHRGDHGASLWEASVSKEDIQVLFSREVGRRACQIDEALWYKTRMVLTFSSKVFISILDLYQVLP